MAILLRETIGSVIGRKEITVISVAALAVTICFALAASFAVQYNNNLLAYAQETTTDGSVSGILGQINGTVIAISGLMATAMSIVTGVVAWLRTKFGDKIISKDTTDWLENLFEKIQKKDGEYRQK